MFISDHFSHICTTLFLAVWGGWPGSARHFHTFKKKKKKSYSQHIQEGRMRQHILSCFLTQQVTFKTKKIIRLFCAEKEPYACCCRLLICVANYVFFFFFKDVGSWAVVFISFFINCLSMQSLLPVLCFIFSVTLFKKKKKTQGMYHNQTDIRTVQISFLQGVCESWVFFEGKVEAFLEVVLLIIKSFFPPWFFPELPAFATSVILICWWWLCKWISLIFLRGNLDHCGSRKGDIINKKGVQD